MIGDNSYFSYLFYSDFILYNNVIILSNHPIDSELNSHFVITKLWLVVALYKNIINHFFFLMNPPCTFKIIQKQ